jgi:hypothetical protein
MRRHKWLSTPRLNRFHMGMTQVEKTEKEASASPREIGLLSRSGNLHPRSRGGQSGRDPECPERLKLASRILRDPTMRLNGYPAIAGADC